MPNRPVLRCFPRADVVFRRAAEQGLEALLAVDPGGQPAPERLEEHLRRSFPFAQVRAQEPFATLTPDETVWYAYRREELAAAVAPAAGDAGGPIGAAARANGSGGVPMYSASRVAEMVGLPLSIIARWDEQDGLVTPARTPGNLPLYARDHVEELIVAKREFAAGRTLDEVQAALHAHRTGRRNPVPSAEPRQGRRLLVLLAERDRYAAEFSEYFLRTEGYDVEITYGAAEAHAMAEQLRPDLAVVELLISGGAGAELCARLKAGPGSLVLAISSLDNEDAALRAGADAFLVKPFEALTFVSAVKDLLGESAMLRRARGQESEPAQ
jgi:CheY-like chemotaxis protein